MKSFRPLLLLLVIMAPLAARADSSCDFYKKFLPRIYEINCKGGNKAIRGSAGSGSAAVADSFRINPSSIPNEPSPWGIETINSYVGPNPFQQGLGFALIKGFHKIGGAISTAGNNSFYGDDVYQRLYGTSEYATLTPAETAKGYVSHLNLGSSVGLLKPRGPNGVSVSLGFSGRYNKTTNTLGWGTGFISRWRWFGLGAGIAREQVSNLLPGMYFYSVNAGATVAIFELEYTFLRHSGGPVMEPIHIVTLTSHLGPLLVTTAWRTLKYELEGQVHQRHFAFQLPIGKRFTVGYMIDYIPGTHSMALQVYL